MTVIISLNSHHDTLPELENATAATAITIGSRALSFSGPLLSVDVEFCLFVKEYQELTPLSRIFTRIAHTGVPYFQMG